MPPVVRHWLTRRGDRRLIAWSNTRLVDERGEIAGVVATGIDITDRTRAEDALRREGEKLRQLNRTLKALSESNQALMRGRGLRRTARHIAGRGRHPVGESAAAAPRSSRRS